MNMEILDDCDGASGTPYVLDIEKYVTYVNPRDYDITDIQLDDPRSYFITSGDAVVKADYLTKYMWKMAGVVRRRFGKSTDDKEKAFEKKVWECAGRCQRMLNVLTKLRGDNIFLETEWRDHVLYVIPKNPRKKE